MAQGNVEQHSVRTKGVALLQIAQRNVEWYSVRLNSIALREMAQRNVEWYSVYTNGVALCRIALQNIRRSIWTLNSLALHEIFRCCGESSCLLVGFGQMAFTSRHQKCKLQMEQWSAGGMTSSNVKTVAKPSHGVRVLLRLAVKQSQFGEFLLLFPADIAFIRCRSWKR